MADYVWQEGGEIVSMETGEDRTQCHYPLFEPGDRIVFGSWGGEPIAWRVLEDEWGTVLLITEKVIDCMPYNDTDENITWESCSLRRWLNGPFLKGAFGDAERAPIVPATVSNPDMFFYGDRYGTRGGPDTWDRVFCLSLDGAKRYFQDDADRLARPTAKAESEGVWKPSDNGGSIWWLRSPATYQNRAVCVGSDGQIYTGGNCVDRDDVGIRPVITLEYWD